jgi:hypothetical protein
MIMEMANYIISIFKTNLPVIMSWGFNNPIGLENGLRCSVNGFKHKGNIAVRYNEGLDLFDIEILTIENEEIETIEGVYFDQLIEVIDNRVERVENYDQAVQNEYNPTNDIKTV